HLPSVPQTSSPDQQRVTQLAWGSSGTCETSCSELAVRLKREAGKHVTSAWRVGNRYIRGLTGICAVMADQCRRIGCSANSPNSARSKRTAATHSPVSYSQYCLIRVAHFCVTALQDVAGIPAHWR